MTPEKTIIKLIPEKVIPEVIKFKSEIIDNKVD